LFFLSLVRVSLAQIDTTYIQQYKHKLIVTGFVTRDILFLAVDGPDKSQMYMPNNPAELGFGLSWNNTVLSFSYGYGFDFLRDKKLGKTRSVDFQAHHYGSKLGYDLSLQKYKGFYLEDDNSSADFILCPDLMVQQYGLSGYYILNSKTFSYRAAFNQSEKQRKSAGSIILGTGVYFTKIKSDSSFVYSKGNALDNFQFGVSVGYAYTWVLGKRWHISAAVTGGINFGSEKIKTFGRQKLEVYPTVFPRLAVGYNHELWALRLSYISNMTFPSFSEDETLGIFAGGFMLAYVRRIEDVPLLSRILK